MGGSQEIDKVSAVGGSPAGAEVVAGEGKEEVGVDSVSVIAGGDIVKGGGIVLALGNGVDGRVEKTDGGFAVFEGLLIDEGE